MAVEALVRLVSRIGSYRDAGAVMRGVVSGLVFDLGFEGAAIRGPEFAFEEGKTTDATLTWVIGADKTELTVFGAATDDKLALAAMLAGRCVHVLDDARRDDVQRTLLEGLSHELRAPLQSLLGYLDLLRRGSFGPLEKQQAEALDKVADNADRILAVARDVLQVARIDSGNERAEWADVDLFALLAAEVETARPLAEAAGLTLALDCPEGLCLESDGAKIGRIVTNLVVNAVKYTPAGGVTVRARRTGDDVAVEVADTGPGIPEESREAVFEEYVQLGDAAGGTGLGLAIARRLAKLLGGRLEVAPEAAEGTTMRLTLPFVQTDRLAD